MKDYNINQQFEAFKDDRWPDSCYYFYDWFCKDRSLKNKANSLMRKVRKFLKHVDIDATKHYVWFKNNCPMCGSLYDDFRIADCETQDVVYTVIPFSGHNNTKGRAEVWGRENNFEKPIVVAESWAKLVPKLSTAV